MRRAAGTALCVIALAVMTCGLLSNASRAASEHGTRPTSRQILWDARSAPLEVLVGQMVMLGFRGTTFEQDSEIWRDIVQGHLGGVIFFDRDIQFPGRPRNIVSPRQTRALIAAMQGAASIPLFVAVDQEGGAVLRLKPEKGFMDVPSAAELGKGTPDTTRECAARLGEELHALGFNMNFAPVADIAVTADSPVIGRLGRAFSADPELVTSHDRAFLSGLAASGVIGCLKHFPGHGSARQDTHLGVADISKTWQPSELLPYKKLICEGVAPVVMVGHVYHSGLDPHLPASLSTAIINGLLRQNLGFRGVVVSDDLQMKAIRDHFTLRETLLLSLQAGVDILLFGNNLEYDPDLLPEIQRIMRELVESGVVSRERLEASYSRIMALKAGPGIVQEK